VGKPAALLDPLDGTPRLGATYGSTVYLNQESTRLSPKDSRGSTRALGGGSVRGRAVEVSTSGHWEKRASCGSSRENDESGVWVSDEDGIWDVSVAERRRRAARR
jgi:hypothetical protein